MIHGAASALASIERAFTGDVVAEAFPDGRQQLAEAQHKELHLYIAFGGAAVIFNADSGITPLPAPLLLAPFTAATDKP